MIYCAHCGTQNRDGSKFCNNCGARLAAESGLRCPMCSTLNQVENVFCSNCGARLVPLTAASVPEEKPAALPIKGLSLPAKPGIPIELSAEESEERAPESAETEEPIEKADEKELPYWIAHLRSASPAEGDESAPQSEEAGALPDWATAAPEEQVEETSSVDMVEDHVPDWLMQAEPATEEPPVPEPQPELPDWLEQGQPQAQDAASPMADEKEELPDWLARDTPEPSEPEMPTESSEVEAAIEEPERAEPLIESLEAAEVFPTSDEASRAASIDDDIPDWLRTAAPETAVETAEEIEQPRPEEVPAWVAALKPPDVITPRITGLEDETVESAGPLAGLRGVLPLAVAITEPHPPAETRQPSSRADGSQIFEAILAAPPEATAPPKPARRALTMRPLIYLLLFIAVIVPFFLPTDVTGSTFGIAGTAAAEFYDTLQKIPAGSTLLVSFDYDPSLAGEMDLQASAVVRDLVRRRMKIVAVSTLETGPQLAQRILESAARETESYVYGSNYVIVYLAGHEAGLGQLAVSGLANNVDYVEKKPIAQFAAAASLKSLRDVWVIELAGTEEPLKAWVEQVQPRAGIRIAAGVSAAVEPKARAYRNANQLAAMMGGLLGAAQYEVLSNQPQLAVISVNAQTAAQITLVFVIVLGNVVYWISRARGNAA